MAQVSKVKPEKEQSAEQVTVKQELETWVDKKLMAVTLEGETIYFPEKIGLGKEIQLRNALSDKLSTIVGMFSTLEDSGELPEGAFSFFFNDFYELLPGLVSIVISTKGTQRSEEWVAENLDADTCQEIITPFFGNLLRMAPMQMLGAGPMAGMAEIAGMAAPGAQKRPKKPRSPK
jgi:hypothetical protein